VYIFIFLYFCFFAFFANNLIRVIRNLLIYIYIYDMIIIDELFRRIRFYLTFFTKKSNKNDIIILELQTLLKNHIANTEGNIKRCLDNQEYILYELKKINRYKDLQNEVW